MPDQTFECLDGEVEARHGSRWERPTDRRGGSMGGISVGGILVIIGIIIAIFWSLWIGVIVGLIGLLAFGGFARGRWY
jgi:hypothetical protein